MAVNAFVSFFDKADGESIQKGKETRVSNAGTPEGKVVQRVEMVFRTVRIEYRPRDGKTGKLGAARTFSWDIPAGTASPSA